MEGTIGLYATSGQISLAHPPGIAGIRPDGSVDPICGIEQQPAGAAPRLRRSAACNRCGRSLQAYRLVRPVVQRPRNRDRPLPVGRRVQQSRVEI